MDKVNWSPEEAVQLAKELNYFGTHYRNAVACLYNTFTYELADYWRGDNYNKVAEFVNSHYDDFDTITNNICCVIPTTIQTIAGLQAENGLGTVTTFNYEINLPGDGAVDFNLIPMTEKSADGSIKLTEELAKKYIDGTNNPSLPYYKNLMEEYMNGYISTLEQFSGIKEFNEALKIVFEHVESYKAYSLEVSGNIIEQTRLRANVELGIISDADAATKENTSLSLEGYNEYKSTFITSPAQEAMLKNNANTGNSSFVQPANANSEKIGQTPQNFGKTAANSANKFAENISQDVSEEQKSAASEKFSQTSQDFGKNATKNANKIGENISEDIRQNKETRENTIESLNDYDDSQKANQFFLNKNKPDTKNLYEINGQKCFIKNIKDGNGFVTVEYWAVDKDGKISGDITKTVIENVEKNNKIIKFLKNMFKS